MVIIIVVMIIVVSIVINIVLMFFLRWGLPFFASSSFLPSFLLPSFFLSFFFRFFCCCCCCCCSQGVMPFMLQDAVWGDQDGYGYVSTSGAVQPVYQQVQQLRCSLGLPPAC